MNEKHNRIDHMQKAQNWFDCDYNIKNYVNLFVDLLIESLKEMLTGIYLHGSLAMGSYYFPKSDIDIIAVVPKELCNETKKYLSYKIAVFSDSRPTIGDVEFSIITESMAKNIPNPMPYELHYSSSLYENIINNKIDHDIKKYDADLYSHIMYVKQRGICLYGNQINDVFGDVAWSDFMFSILEDLKWILENENILESPYYSIFNICRVFQILDESTKNVHSKDEGAVWGLLHFPEEYRSIIKNAVDVYHSDKHIDDLKRKTGGIYWDEKSLLSFRNYAKQLLKSYKIYI